MENKKYLVTTDKTLSEAIVLSILPETNQALDVDVEVGLLMKP